MVRLVGTENINANACLFIKNICIYIGYMKSGYDWMLTKHSLQKLHVQIDGGANDFVCETFLFNRISQLFRETGLKQCNHPSNEVSPGNIYSIGILTCFYTFNLLKEVDLICITSHQSLLSIYPKYTASKQICVPFSCNCSSYAPKLCRAS